MNTVQRVIRHARITTRNYQKLPSPPFLILFINSICNQKCEHCFYWRNLNRRDDLTKEEIFALSRSLGRIENLNLSGGEPFLRPEFGEICRQFIRHNKVRQIYVPTNGYFTDRTVKQITETLKEADLDLFVAEISLDGLREFHNKFRGSPGAFDKAMADLRRPGRASAKRPAPAHPRHLHRHRREHGRDPPPDHVPLRALPEDGPPQPGDDPRRPQESVARRPQPDRIPAALRVRPAACGRRAKRAATAPSSSRCCNGPRPQTAVAQAQVVPCRAGVLTAVVYSNGDVSVCETHAPLGNLREKSFREIWSSAEAQALRRSIAAKECYCTNEVFLWPSITYQPTRLVQAMIGGKVWQGARPGAVDQNATPPRTGGPGGDGLVTIQVPGGRA